MKNEITAETITLEHRQEVRVKGFSNLASRITVGTVRGVAKQYGEDPELAMERTLDQKHQTAWTSQEPAVLEADYPGKKEALDARKAATAAAVEIEDGQVVIIEGEEFTVRVIGQRYSDPVHFHRVK